MYAKDIFIINLTVLALCITKSYLRVHIICNFKLINSMRCHFRKIKFIKLIYKEFSNSILAQMNSAEIKNEK